MKFTPHRTYGALLELVNTPPIASYFSTDAVLKCLKKWCASRTAHASCAMTPGAAIAAFERFLLDRSDTPLNEALLHHFHLWCRTQPADNVKGNVAGSAGCLRDLLHEVGKAEHWLERELLPQKSWSRYARIERLTPLTRTLLVHYEVHAKQYTIRELTIQLADKSLAHKIHYGLTGKPLAEYPRHCRIQRMLHFLEVCERRGIEEVTASDVDHYLKFGLKGGLQGHEKDIMEVASVFVNLHLQGKLPTNPLAEISIPARRGGIAHDFLVPESIQRLQDAATVPEKFKSGDYRSLVFCNLAYDTAMRLRELLSLNVGDIRDDPENDMMTIHVAADIQKGQTAQYRLLCLYFPATRHALRHHLRQHDGDPNAPLFQAVPGRRLSAMAAAHGVNRITDKLGIKSFHGKACTPHLFRHTFATLNIQPLGLALDLEEIVSRLRHQDRNLAHRIYIANNPFLEQLKATARIEELQAKTGKETFTPTPGGPSTGREHVPSAPEAVPVPDDVRLNPQS